MYQDVVKNHHYVWAHYLRAWTSDNKVWYVTNKGNIRCDAVTGLSREKGYNRIDAFNEEDLEYLSYWIKSDGTTLERFLASQLEYFAKISNIINLPLGREAEVYHSDLIKLSEQAQYNTFEKSHTTIENLAMPVIEELRKGNAKILDSGYNMVSFCNFLAHQLFRTKKNKARVIRRHYMQTSATPQLENFGKLFEKN